MISATIDNSNYQFDGSIFYPVNNVERMHLRVTHFVSTMTDTDRDEYIEAVSKKYKSIPSHLFNYHISRKHDCLLIDSSEFDMNMWRLKRMASLYESARQKHSLDIEYVNDNCAVMREIATHFPRQITLRDVLEGNLIKRLIELGHTDLNESLYYDWLEQILIKNPL